MELSEKQDYAPVVIFTYNRLEHTKKTIEALKNNLYAKNTDVYIYSDAPKKIENEEEVNKVRSYLKTVQGFNIVKIIERTENWGLAKNIMDGVTSIVNQYGKVIVLEDDIVTSKYFLKYMNDSLILYESSPEVMEISGYSYPMKKKNLPQTVLLHFGDCWGWATWKRSWDLFERNPSKLIKDFTKKDIYHFNLENSYDFWKQVINNEKGVLFTWAIFWTATIYLNNGYLLYPRDSLVRNIGFDGSGDHKSKNSVYLVNTEDYEVTEFPKIIEENTLARNYLKEFFKKQNPSLLKRIIKKLLQIMKL